MNRLGCFLWKVSRPSRDVNLLSLTRERVFSSVYLAFHGEHHLCDVLSDRFPCRLPSCSGNYWQMRRDHFPLLSNRIREFHINRKTSIRTLDRFSGVSFPQVPAMWFRLYENAYPQPLILGDRQLIDDHRFMLRTQNEQRHLEIVGVRKDDQGYYLCKAGNDIQASYNLTILSKRRAPFALSLTTLIFSLLATTCIEIIPQQIYVTVDEPLQLICRVHSPERLDESDVRSVVQWTRNNHPLKWQRRIDLQLFDDRCTSLRNTDDQTDNSRWYRAFTPATTENYYQLQLMWLSINVKTIVHLTCRETLSFQIRVEVNHVGWFLNHAETVPHRKHHYEQ